MAVFLTWPLRAGQLCDIDQIARKGPKSSRNHVGKWLAVKHFAANLSQIYKHATGMLGR
jgi:hypothetical protein